LPAAADRAGVCPCCGQNTSEPLRPSVEQWQQWLGAAVAHRLGMYRIPPELRLSVLVPAYNEEGTIAEIIRRIRAVPIPKEVIVVEDGSSDGTRQVLESMQGEPDLRIFFHPQNCGKGAALRTAMSHVTGDIVIIQDADLEYNPEEYPQLIRPIVEGNADVVFGSRFITDGPHRVFYYWHSVANRLLTLFSNLFTDLGLSDMETCFKVFRRDVVEALAPTLKENRFGIEPELAAKIARRGYRVFEMGISYSGRTYEEGKKIGLRDAIRAIWCIVRYSRWD
jgi:glycosyltransferase involved in cell wall biosynthesis